MNSRRPDRIVVKIGSSLLAHTERLTLRYAFMNGLLADIAALRARGHDVVLCSSGAVALGLNAVDVRPEEAGVLEKQAAAAYGMPLLLNAYKQISQEHGFDIAQVLLTLEDMEARRRFLNTRNTIMKLFEHGIMPIVNENDTVTTEEIRVGDNDRLAAKVAQMIQADKLIILTSIDGLYDRNPADPEAQFVAEVEDVCEYLEVTQSTNALGSGGMMTKMQAANMAQNAGCETWIGKGEIDRPLLSLLEGGRRFTRCAAKGTPESSWAVWLTNRLHQAGGLSITQAAADGLASGETAVTREEILSVHGDFQKGDVLHLFDESGEERARGLSNFSAHEILQLARQPERKASDVLGYSAKQDLISPINLVVLNDQHIPWQEPDSPAREISASGDAA